MGAIALIRYIMSGLLVVVALPVISEFFIRWAEEQGAYESPSNTVAGVVAALADSWWFAIAFGFFAGGTLFMWADVLLRKVTIVRPNIPTSIRMQFQAGSVNAIQLANQNIASSHFERQQFNFYSDNGELVDQRTLWLGILLFKQPTHYGQIVVDAGNAVIPPYEVISQKHNFALIRFGGDIGNVAIEIRCIPPNSG